MLPSDDLADGADEGVPAAALLGQRLLAFACDLVDAAAPFARLFRPAPLNPAALLQLVEQRIQGRGVKRDRATGSLLDQRGDVIAVPRAHFDERQDEKFSAALFELARVFDESHVWESYISGPGGDLQVAAAGRPSGLWFVTGDDRVIRMRRGRVDADEARAFQDRRQLSGGELLSLRRQQHQQRK